MVDQPLGSSYKMIRKAVLVNGEVHEQLLHRVGPGRSDGLQQSFPLKREQRTGNLVGDAVGLKSIIIGRPVWGYEHQRKGHGYVSVHINRAVPSVPVTAFK